MGTGMGTGTGIDDDEVDDNCTDDVDDEDDAPRIVPARHRFVLVTAGKRVETRVWREGRAVRIDTTESFANPADAERAYDAMVNALVGQGYNRS